MGLESIFGLCFSLHFPCRQAQRSAGGESLRFSQAFSKHGSDSGHTCAPLDFLVRMEPFKALLPPAFFFPGFLVCYQEVVAGIFPFKCSLQMLPRKLLHPYKSSKVSKAKAGRSLSQSLQRTSRHVKPHYHNSLKAVHITLSGISKPLQEHELPSP